MEDVYRLEFNENQQEFHFDDHKREENTHGWFTIFEYCTELEFEIYHAYVNRIPQKKLTKQYLLKCASEVEAFLSNLLKAGLVVRYPEADSDKD
jgi:hypothetical protein